MWYYSKDGKEKKGPISDAAVAIFYKRGQINKSTQMWSPEQKQWKPFNETSIYNKIRKGRTSQHLLELQKNTKLLRSFLTSLLVCLVASVYFKYDNILEFLNFLALDGVIDKVEMMIKSTENALTQKLISFILLVLFVFSSYYLFRWVKSSVINAKLFAKRFSFHTNFAAMSLLIPVLNIFIPQKVLSEAYRATLKSLRKRVRVRYILLLFTWQIFWAISAFMLAISLFILPQSCPMDFFMPLFMIRILFNLTYIVTIALTLCVVTILYNMQSKRLAIFR